MFNHEPDNYRCPFCLIANGDESKDVRSKQSDIVWQDKNIIAFIASDWWPNNPGHVIVAPRKHIENIYDIPMDLLVKVHELEKKIAMAMKKVYVCDGISSRQHNEPDGGQDVWHYHLSVFPRYKDDNLYQLIKQRKPAEDSQRKVYANRLKDYFQGT